VSAASVDDFRAEFLISGPLPGSSPRRLRRISTIDGGDAFRPLLGLVELPPVVALDGEVRHLAVTLEEEIPTGASVSDVGPEVDGSAIPAESEY